ncbi:hypothetical protein [Parafrankia sp. FMc2]|uniref:hypothetical protein n=1 Tax=Parafrankia sp. FMc2 TaxID=3233196 RepID=UPI0034D6A9E7
MHRKGPVHVEYALAGMKTLKILFGRIRDDRWKPSPVEAPIVRRTFTDGRQQQQAVRGATVQWRYGGPRNKRIGAPNQH